MEEDLDEMMHGDDPKKKMEEEEQEMGMGDDVDAEIDEDKLMKALEGAKEAVDALEEIAAAAGLEDREMEPMDDMEEPKDMEMDDQDEDEDMMEDLAEVELELNEEEIVNEVARRVAKRIVEARRAHKKMNEALGRRKK